MIELFVLKGNTVVPSVHCFNISWLKEIMDNYPKEYIKIYSYLYYMSCMDPKSNPYANFDSFFKEDTILKDLGLDRNIVQREDIKLALKKTQDMYTTPLSRMYNSLQILIDKISNYIKTCSVDDKNIKNIVAYLKDFDSIKEQYLKATNDFIEENNNKKIKVRGNQHIAYDQN